MNTYIVKGDICFSRSMDEIVCLEQCSIVVENGRVTGVFQTLPARYAALPVLDYGRSLILPGMSDLHVHAPQFAFRGLGMDMALLEYAKSRKPSLTLSVYQKNQRALAFYRREQFVVQSEGIDEDTNEADIQMLWTRQA